MGGSVADAPFSAGFVPPQHTLLDQLPYGLMLLDADGRLLWENRTLMRWLGIPDGDQSPVLGQRIADLPNVAEALGETTLQRVVRGDPLENVALDFQSMLGQTLSFQLTSGPLDDGTPAAVWVSLTQLAKGDEVSGRLLAAQRMEFVGVAVAGVIHDLNNLMTALGGTVSMLRSGEDASDRLLTALEAMLRRSRDITRQLLQAAGRKSSGPEALDLRTPVRQTADLFRHSFGPAVEVHLDLPAYQVPVFGERVKLLQALFNLGVNARDAIGGEGRIDLRLAAVRDSARCGERGWPGHRYALIEVWDDGPGIPPAVADKIFEPFFSTKAPDRGTGMGLSVVQASVWEHDGRIAVRHVEGRGASFAIELPMHLGAVDDDEPTRALSLPRVLANPEQPLTGCRLLVADDEPALRLMLATALDRQGANVVAVEDGERALLALADAPEPFDAAVVDLNMPGMPGLQAIRGLRATDPDLRIIATSGLGPDAAQQAALGEANAEFLAKPFGLGEIVEVLLMSQTDDD
jgi:two-component system cell cycle sensor histidine kinase/response regulator CckA